ncbi:MAG: N-6 DNA methylase [Defluviitaleaceae bacterium]|nr:N-6 DNA methylase [Defluviitaleaceae bacterium]
METMPLEAATRHLVDTNLKNLGWVLDVGKNQNVWLEQPKTEAERKKLGGKRPDYVLYSEDSETPEIPVAIIETKKKGARIDTALEQGILYARTLKAPLVFATDGVFCKSYHTMGNTTPKLNGEDIDKFIRETLALKYLTQWEVNTISPKVQYDRKELIKIFDETNNMLRGDGLRAGIERFGEFANILFLKLISEAEDNKKMMGIKSAFDDMCHWSYIKKLKSNSRIEHINKIVYDKLNALYGTTIFTPLLIRDSDILKEIMDKLDPLTLTDVDSDVKGDAFEYFLKASTASKNDLGEYFTPRHIVKTMVRLVNPQIGEKIYDPFCGTGGFLIETFRHIHNNMPRNPTTEEMLRKQTIFGNEITNTARITKMNMILAGDGHSGIDMRDSLQNPVDGEYDVVLANMPYSQKTKHGKLYDISSTNGDSICVQHCMKAIRATADNGRMALVVPEGFLFRKDLAKVREYLLENCQLQSIISLPQGVFLPYTSVKTNIIYATKVNQKLKSAEKRKDFWYFDVKSDGKTLDNHRRDSGNGNGDLDKYLEYRKFDDEQKDDMMKVGFEIIPLDKVRDNSFIFVGSRYREQKINQGKYPIVRLGDVCKTTSGGTPLTSNDKYYSPAEIPWINSSEVRNGEITSANKYISQLGLQKSSAKIVPPNSVLVAMYGATAGQVGILKFEASTNQAICAILPSELYNPKFLYYILSSQTDYMVELSIGGAQPNITQGIVQNLEVPLPPLDMQQQIVDELDSYQGIVDGARAVVESYSPKIQLNNQWDRKNISDISDEIKSGFACGVHNKTEKGILHIRPMNITTKGLFSLDGSKFIDTEILEQRKQYLLKKGDILFNNTNSKELVGKTCYIHEDMNALFSNHITRMRVDFEKFNPKFIAIQLHNIWESGYFEEHCRKWIGQAGFDINELSKIELSVPSIDIQNQIVEQIEREQALVEPSKQLIEVFTKKIQDKINEILS